jgi:hypothetical protein
MPRVPLANCRPDELVSNHQLLEGARLKGARYVKPR